MPPLTRFIAVRRLSGKDALNGLIATSSVTKEVADLLQFMPLKAAASLLLLVLETIQVRIVASPPSRLMICICAPG